jgi:DNA-binding transcriptional regulator GbsR (MarR family)
MTKRSLRTSHLCQEAVDFHAEEAALAARHFPLNFNRVNIILSISTEIGETMTLAADSPSRALPPAVQQKLQTAQDLFIRRWGEMGQTWGINRTMAEIHALLYVVGEPLCTDDVMERLNISRGNASMSLRALCDWGIIHRVHKRGERREYFESLSDVWELFSMIVAERKRREMDPVLETIKQCGKMLDEESLGKQAARSAAVQLTRQRLDGMEEFMEVSNKIFQQFIGNARSGLTRVVRVLLKAF